MTPEEVIDRYYTRGSRLREILETHSSLVAEKALACAKARQLDIDADFVREAALLHDIGIVACDAPDICCTGDLPYICHGVEGRRMLDSLGMPRHALVCERHTGAGLTVDDIVRQGLPLPLRDMTPRTREERLICYADKFYSKSGDIRKEKDIDRVIRSMERHGADTLSRFLALHEEFG